MITPHLHCVVVAAGVGKRFGSATPKQYTNIHHLTALQHSILALSQVHFGQTKAFERCCLVISDEDSTAKTLDFALPMDFVLGGAERMHSVFHGVRHIWQQCQAKQHQTEQRQVGDISNHWVLIHDAARPCVLATDIERLIVEVCENQEQAGGLLAVPVRDTVKRQARQGDNIVSQQTLDRSQLWLAQTPQIFPLATLYPLLKKAIKESIEFTDEASLFEHFGLYPRLIAGSHSNIKLTFPEDLLFAKAFLA
nr:2-C-methyl-D-erythritol 4-phosphate cytidylyltransferase [uncultured Moraxella sp.]